MFNINLTNVWNRIADLYCWKLPLCQLSHNNYPNFNVDWEDPKINEIETKNSHFKKMWQPVIVRRCLALLSAYLTHLKTSLEAEDTTKAKLLQLFQPAPIQPKFDSLGLGGQSNISNQSQLKPWFIEWLATSDRHLPIDGLNGASHIMRTLC